MEEMILTPYEEAMFKNIDAKVLPDVTYNIKSLHLKRGATLVVNLLSETPESYKVIVYDVQNCPFNIWSNGDRVTLNKSLIK